VTRIRRSEAGDAPALRELHEAAFGPDEGPLIADLVDALLRDPTAEALLSLVAEADEALIGHVLFTRVRIEGADMDLSASILAPLAVRPDLQRQGIGTQLVERGLEMLEESGSDLVFVLGHPAYYPRFGFQPAGAQALVAPYPIAEKNSDAWMVLEQRAGLLGRVKGTVQCADALNRPEYWVE